MKTNWLQIKFLDSEIKNLCLVANNKGSFAGLHRIDEDFERFVFASLHNLYTNLFGNPVPQVIGLDEQIKNLANYNKEILEQLKESQTKSAILMTNKDDGPKGIIRRFFAAFKNFLKTLPTRLRLYFEYRRLLRRHHRLEKLIHKSRLQSDAFRLDKQKMDNWIENKKTFILEFYNLSKIRGQKASLKGGK